MPGPSLLRVLRSPEAWAEYGEKLEKEGDCPSVLLREVFDPRDGTSVFQVATPEDMDKVMVQMAFNDGFKDRTYVLLDPAKVKEFAQVKQKPAEFGDNATRQMHRNIEGLSAKGSIRLAQLVLKSEFKMMREIDALKRLAELLAGNKINGSELVTGSNREKAGQRLCDLWKKGRLQIKVPNPAAS